MSLQHTDLVTFEKIKYFECVHLENNLGSQLELIRQTVPEFRTWFASTGKVDAFYSYDLVTLPYPSQYGFWRAVRTRNPFIWLTNRMLLVQWQEENQVKTLLYEPSDFELGANTPYFSGLMEKYGSTLSNKMFSKHHDTVQHHLESVGLRPEDVDFIAFDHLHTQDLRRWLGTRKPQPDISPDSPLEAYFPNAKLVVQRSEWEVLSELHPLQKMWYQPQTYADIPRDKVLFIDGDVRLGPGIALVWTPGHTIGNQSLVVNTETGIWVSSENAIAAECLNPESSRIPGLRRYQNETGFEVVLNGNTLENPARQYNSLVQEKLIADPVAARPEYRQFFPSSELSVHALSPGIKPSFRHAKLEFGQIRRNQ